MTDAVEGSLHIPQMRAYLYTLRDHLPMFVIYDHPNDWPEFYVASLWVCLPSPYPLPTSLMDPDLERLQETMEALGLVKLIRNDYDDPVILETWL